ncbi:MAG: acyl-CoA thioesterase [Pseudomonadota bacterium]
MTTTVRGNVKAWECDLMEHMNVQHYLGRSAETLGQLRVLLGLPAGSVLRPRRERVLFLRELRDGASFEIATGILALRRSGLTTFNEMRNIDSGASAARFVIELDLTDAAGAPLPLPEPCLAAAEPLRIAAPEDLRPPARLRQPPARDWATAEALGLLDTARGTIEPWECDARGELHPRFFMARCSDAVTHLQHHYGLTPDYRRARGLGSAALEYDIEFHRPLRAGDAIVTRSGLREMEGKIQRFFHWFLNAASRETAATVETAGTLFDFESRRSVPIPDDLRARAAPLVQRF